MDAINAASPTFSLGWKLPCDRCAVKLFGELRNCSQSQEKDWECGVGGVVLQEKALRDSSPNSANPFATANGTELTVPTHRFRASRQNCNAGRGYFQRSSNPAESALRSGNRRVTLRKSQGYADSAMGCSSSSDIRYVRCKLLTRLVITATSPPLNRCPESKRRMYIFYGTSPRW
jgi:hypothetical protein